MLELADGSDQTVLESAPFDIVIARHEKPTGYKIKVEDNKVIITNATGLEFSFDGKNYFDETELMLLILKNLIFTLELKSQVI